MAQKFVLVLFNLHEWVQNKNVDRSNTCQTVVPASHPSRERNPKWSDVGRPDLELFKAGNFKANISSSPSWAGRVCYYWNQDNRYWVTAKDWMEIFHQLEPSSRSRWLCGKKTALKSIYILDTFCLFMFLAQLFQWGNKCYKGKRLIAFEKIKMLCMSFILFYLLLFQPAW